MAMNMYIVMHMNIYITTQNEEKLRQEKSMSGLINQLLDQHYGHSPFNKPLPHIPGLVTGDMLQGKDAIGINVKLKDVGTPIEITEEMVLTPEHKYEPMDRQP